MENTCFSYKKITGKCKLLTMMFAFLLLCCSLTGCGPSEEKILEAQQKYAELTSIHNAVVEAHQNVSDASLDAELTAMQDKTTAITEYNLQEMKDEEIDTLIKTMDSLIASYQEYQTSLTEIKAQEEAAVLIPIPVTLTNNTGFSFTSISLCEEGNHDTHTNVLENLSALNPTQTLTGLLIQRDVDNTPWQLILTDTEGTTRELSIPAENYTEEGVTLYLTYDSESATLSFHEKTDVVTEENETDDSEAVAEENETGDSETAPEENTTEDITATEAETDAQTEDSATDSDQA